MGICESTKKQETKNIIIEEKDQTTGKSESFISNKTLPEKYKKNHHVPKKSITQISNLRKSKKKKSVISSDSLKKKKRSKTLNYYEEPHENNLEINTQLIVNCNNKNPKDEYKIIKKLGKGGYGTVWKVKNIQTNLFRAMKKIPKMRNNLNKVNEIINEIEILKHLDHPNIVKIFEFFIEADGYYIITEYCHEGELFHLIKEKGYFSEKIAANIMYQIFNAMNYCHLTNNVIHRDLKPENIMIESKDYETGFYNIKIIDFGTAKIREKDKSENKVLGSCFYIAPEVLNKNYNEKCDIWSCGVILYILLCGNVPFNGRDEREITQKIKLGKFDLNRSPFEQISDEGKDLIKQCLEMNVNKRISAKEALDHPWFDLWKTKEYFTNVNDYFMKKPINNLIMYKPINKLQKLALAYLVHNFSDLNEIKNINKVFNLFNKSGNGKLTKEETYQGLKDYLHSSSEEKINKKVNKIFKNIDNDNNGFIEYEEFARAALDKRIFLDENVLKFTFDFMDKDGSGEISLFELKEIFGVKDDKETENLLKEIIHNIDTDGNGEISFKEYNEMMKNIII